MIWAALAAMTAAVVLALVWPLSARRTARGAATADVDFYRSQLAEIEDDIGRGLVAPAEAEAARTEIGRRLLASAEALTGPGAAGPGGLKVRRYAALAAALVAVPAVALAVYLRVGAPDQPDMPVASRTVDPEFNLAEALSRIEAHLAADPSDGRGFALVAPLYARLGRADDAVRAYAAALRLLGDTAERRAALGQARTAAADGVVTTEARADFERALVLDPKLPQGRFFLALAAEQDGDKPRAAQLWQALQADSPADAPWREAVRQHLAALSGVPAPAGPPAEAAAGPGAVPPGPAASAIAALPTDQQAAAIRGMVDGLAARLAQNGRDPEGWLRLIRAYTVMGDTAKAKAAVTEARRGLTGDGAALSRVDDLARQLGLEG